MITDRPEYEEDAFGYGPEFDGSEVVEYESVRYVDFTPPVKCEVIDCEVRVVKGAKFCLLHQIEQDQAEIEFEVYVAMHPEVRGWWREENFAQFKRKMEV